MTLWVTQKRIGSTCFSALTCALGVVLILIVVLLAPETPIVLFVAAITSVGRSVLGGLGNLAGRAGLALGAVRISLWRARSGCDSGDGIAICGFLGG